MQWINDQRGKRRGYHHGNLRVALIDAALRLISEKGPSGFTVAEAARAAGVSPAAPYRHFRDRDEFMAGIARQGFEAFTAVLAKAWDKGRPTPRAALLKLGHAYLGFARSDPAAYAAMFESAAPVQGQTALPRVADEAFAILRQACTEVIAEIPPAQRPPALMAALHIWSLSHGIAGLALRSHAAPPMPVSAEELLEAGILIYLDGLASNRA